MNSYEKCALNPSKSLPSIHISGSGYNPAGPFWADNGLTKCPYSFLTILKPPSLVLTRRWKDAATWRKNPLHRIFGS
jgi:hypothetical protein